MAYRVIEAKYSDYKEQIDIILKEHWDEIQLAGITDIEYVPDYESFLILEELGKHVVVIALDDDNNVMGYMSTVLIKALYHLEVFGLIHLLYIRKKYRGFKTFKLVLQLFKLTEQIVKIKHAIKYLQFSFSCNNDLSKLAYIAGYKPSEKIFIKELQ